LDAGPLVLNPCLRSRSRPQPHLVDAQIWPPPLPPPLPTHSQPPTPNPHPQPQHPNPQPQPQPQPQPDAAHGVPHEEGRATAGAPAQRDRLRQLARAQRAARLRALRGLLPRGGLHGGREREGARAAVPAAPLHERLGGGCGWCGVVATLGGGLGFSNGSVLQVQDKCG